jgi:hypothetical protein
MKHVLPPWGAGLASARYAEEGVSEANGAAGEVFSLRRISRGLCRVVFDFSSFNSCTLPTHRE